MTGRLILQYCGTALLMLAAGRSGAAQVSGTIHVTAQVVASPVLRRAVSAGLRIAAARPPASARPARRDLPGTTILVDTHRDTAAARPHLRITIIPW
jgi:hypothetical protein